MLSNAFFSVNFEQISHIAFVVSIVDFEQVNACCTWYTEKHWNKGKV